MPQKIYDGLMERYERRITGTEGGEHGSVEELYL